MLKILHTADWHLGHSLHGIPREYEHQCFLSWLLDQLDQLKADGLIIAGDIFDSANPSASAQSVFYDFLVQARQRSPSLDIIIIGGNHDSASRLDAPAQILRSLGIKVVGGLTRRADGSVDWQRIIVPMKDNDGVVRAVCGTMPFIRNADLPRSDDTGPLNENDELSDPLISGVAGLYRQLFEHMQQYKIEQGLDNSTAQILTGHCYMVGSELSELSERRILGGNQHALPASIFNKNVDYVALGHLHKAQRVTGMKSLAIHYSGSPLPLSFTEKNYQHQILKIELDSVKSSVKCSVKSAETKTKTTVEPILIPRTVDIQVLPEQGYVALVELASLIEHQGYCEEDKNSQQNREKYPMLEVRIELDKPEPDLRQQIETMLKDKAVRLLKISTHYPGNEASLADQKQQVRLEELHPEDVFQQCYQRTFDQSAPQNMTDAFHQLLESVEDNE